MIFQRSFEKYFHQRKFGVSNSKNPHKINFKHCLKEFESLRLFLVIFKSRYLVGFQKQTNWIIKIFATFLFNCPNVKMSKHPKMFCCRCFGLSVSLFLSFSLPLALVIVLQPIQVSTKRHQQKQQPKQRRWRRHMRNETSDDVDRSLI